ncbi:hypothetical protein LK12_19090 [Novosphingobium malaysiense]|uniref:Uncharacterized protein n=1 Tax=Novosphingobium malaysiense TaxID=1348853 RepID=A0A0B1ZKY9_9SPHN|nr:hypothetical protein LK12_19090 [Novosphingobium malaysiense]
MRKEGFQLCSLNSGCQFSDHVANFCRCVPAYHFNITNAGPAQSFFLNRVAGCSVVAGVMSFALKLNCVKRLAVGINDKKVNALRVDCKERLLVGTGKDFAETYLSHRPPAGAMVCKCCVDYTEQAAFAVIKQWA